TMALDLPLQVLLGWQRIIRSQGRLEIAKCATLFLAYFEVTEITPLTATRSGDFWQTVWQCKGTVRGTSLVITARCASDWHISAGGNKV
ncbi:hypothetical protein ABTE48_19090, partial [Acinetobacter baumannii]